MTASPFCNYLLKPVFPEVYGLLRSRMSDVGARELLLEKLKAARLKPVTLAKALGVSGAMASMILSGKRGVSTWHLDAIAKLLSVQVKELFEPSSISTLPGRRPSDKNKVVPRTQSVTELRHNVPPLLGSIQTGGNHAPSPDTDRLTLDKLAADLQTAKRVDDIIHHATAIIELARATLGGTDFDAPVPRNEIPNGHLGDSQIRHARTGTSRAKKSGTRS
jgi:hypothetical protein